MSTFLNASPDQFKAFMEFPVDSKLHMLNLLKFKSVVDESGLTGEEQYKKWLASQDVIYR